MTEKQTMSEHDLLLKLNGKIGLVFELQKIGNKSVDELKEELKAFKEKIDLRCEGKSKNCSEAFESKLQAKTFWALLTIMVLVIGGVIKIVYDNSKTITKNSTVLESIEKKIPLQRTHFKKDIFEKYDTKGGE